MRGLPPGRRAMAVHAAGSGGAEDDAECAERQDGAGQGGYLGCLLTNGLNPPVGAGFNACSISHLSVLKYIETQLRKISHGRNAEAHCTLSSLLYGCSDEPALINTCAAGNVTGFCEAAGNCPVFFDGSRIHTCYRIACYDRRHRDLNRAVCGTVIDVRAGKAGLLRHRLD